MYTMGLYAMFILMLLKMMLLKLVPCSKAAVVGDGVTFAIQFFANSDPDEVE